MKGPENWTLLTVDRSENELYPVPCSYPVWGSVLSTLIIVCQVFKKMAELMRQYSIELAGFLQVAIQVQW